MTKQDEIHRFDNIINLPHQEDEAETPSRSINGLQGWVDCFEGVGLDTVFAGSSFWASILV